MAVLKTILLRPRRSKHHWVASAGAGEVSKQRACTQKVRCSLLTGSALAQLHLVEDGGGWLTQRWPSSCE